MTDTTEIQRVRDYYEQWNKKLNNWFGFLETNNLSGQQHEATESLNKPITGEEITSVTKNLSSEKCSGQDGLTREFYRTSNSPFQILPKNWRRGNISSFYEASITLIPKPDKDSARKGNYQPISLTNTGAIILNKVLSNGIQKHTERIIHHDQMGVIPGVQACFNIHKSLWTTITRWSSTDKGKAFDKIQLPSMI